MHPMSPWNKFQKSNFEILSKNILPVEEVIKNISNKAHGIWSDYTKHNIDKEQMEQEMNSLSPSQESLTLMIAFSDNYDDNWILIK